MITVYGMKICPDTVAALEQLKAAGTPFVYKDFNESTQNLKDFLKLRDDPANRALFDPIRAAGGIGIPLFVKEDGTVTDHL